jgi:hypothetical protein
MVTVPGAHCLFASVISKRAGATVISARVNVLVRLPQAKMISLLASGSAPVVRMTLPRPQLTTATATSLGTPLARSTTRAALSV